MGEDSKSARTQVIVAIIGLVGVLGTALITQWKNIFPSHSQDIAGIALKPPPPQGPTVADAERLTENYIAALKKGDADSVVGMISVPFCEDKQRYDSKDDIRTSVTRISDSKDRTSEKMPAIESTKGQTIEDFKKSAESLYGEIPDSVLSCLSLKDRDFVVAVVVRHETGLFFIRHDGSSLSMAGIWGHK